MHKPKFVKPEQLYPKASLKTQKERYKEALQKYEEYFYTDGGMGEVRIFSVPGRTEVGGNHTDHNNGKVLAASVNLDIIAIVEPIDVNKIVVKSEGFPEAGVWIDDLNPVESEKNTCEALIRGVCSGFIKNNYKIGGFKAYTTSNVLKGSGLSSSAAFEVLICNVLSYLYNDGKIDPVKIAQISQFAENKFFGKPSGLMDQMACSVGGFVAIDFQEDNAPVVETIDFDFESVRHALCIVDTKGDHADLTGDYASIPVEMKNVAEFFDVNVLRKVSRQDILLNMNGLREKLGDRAVLRALHFFNENERVEKLVHALKKNEFGRFLGYINASGNSSFKYLQNIFTCNDITHQEISIGLIMSEIVLGHKGAHRVHGGGFAGTIQAFVPFELLNVYKMELETVFGANSCHTLSVRKYGGVEVDLSE